MFGKSASIWAASSRSSSTLVWSRDCCTISWVVFTRFQKSSTDPINDSGHTNNGGCIKVVSDMFPFTNAKMSRRSPWPRRRRGTRSSVSIPAPLWGIAGGAMGGLKSGRCGNGKKTSQSKSGIYHSMEAPTPSRGKKENDCGTLMFICSSVFRDR